MFIQPFNQAPVKENIKAPRHWPLWPLTGEFPTQRASNARNVSVWWRHHAFSASQFSGKSPKFCITGPLLGKPTVTLLRKALQYDDVVMIFIDWLSVCEVTLKDMDIVDNTTAQKATTKREPGPWFNIKMSSYQYRKSHCGDKTILRPSYLHNGISYTGKTTSLYWIGAQGSWDIT